MITHVSQASTSLPFEFKRVDEASPLFSTVRSIFEKDLTPLLGDQTEALAKIGKSQNRRCEVALDQENALGFLVWKREIEGEDSFIVQNLHVISQQAQSISAIGKALADRAVKIGQRNGAKKILVTIPEQNSKLLEVLKERQFTIQETKVVKSTGLAKTILSLDLKTKTSALPSDQRGAVMNTGCETSSRDITIRKRQRTPERAYIREETQERETSRRENTQDGHSRKREALGDEKDERPRSYVRSSYESDNRREAFSYARSTSDSRDEPRRGLPISGPYTKGNGWERSQRPYSTYERQMYHGRQEEIGNNPRTSRLEDSRSSGSKSHSVTLMRKYIDQIRSGGKTVEGRINSGMFLNFREGDTVRFFNKNSPGDDVTCRITKVVKFSSFAQMLKEEGVQKCLTDVTRLDEAIRIYDNIPGYKEKAARHGVLAIHLKVQK